MTTAEKIAVMQAYEEGKQIQACDGYGKWYDLHENPRWNWGSIRYRIKPEPTYRPYEDTTEMIEDFKERFGVENPPHTMPLIWLSVKCSNAKILLDGFWVKVVYSADYEYELDKVFNDFTYLDGSPCGKLVEE